MHVLWRLKRRFWNFLVTFKFSHAKALTTPAPEQDEDKVTPVPFASRFTEVPIDGIVVADHIPRDEAQTFALRFCQVQTWLNRAFSPMQRGLPEVDANPFDALVAAYTPAHRRCYRAPVRPPGMNGALDLGVLAVASPYACYLERASVGSYRWDLTRLHGFELHRGLLAPAVSVEFDVDAATSRLRATRIDSELGTAAPGDAHWDVSQRLAVCAATTHLTLVRHFNWLHLVLGAPLAMTARSRLAPNHPVRRLIRPHVYATYSSNEMVTIVQMNRGGDFENCFSFSHKGMCSLFEATREDFDLRMIAPEIDAQRRGIAASAVEQPALDNRLALMGVIRAHVSRYLALYYDSDTAAANDEAVGAWIEDLCGYVPHGVREIAGEPLTIAGLTELISTMIYMATVEHEIVDSGVWDYQLWNDLDPVRVYANNARCPVDVYQRIVNANFILNVPRTPLMSDFSALALDDRGAGAFRQFRSDLATLQGCLDLEPASSWRMEPKFLKANINA